MNRILLVGCGNIGSRHLQAIVKLKKPITIDVIEPSKKAQSLAKYHLSKNLSTHTNHKILWHESLRDGKFSSDLVVIATTSIGKSKLISQLLKSGHSRFLIEKMVCQSKKEYNSIINKMKLYNAKGWVNCPRRYFESYQKILKHFHNSKNVHLEVNSGNIGLGSNAIHFIDLLSWFTKDYRIKLNGDFLLDRILKNKRGKNFVEFVGTIMASSSRGSLILTFLPYENMPQTVEIIDKDKWIQINETDEKLCIIKGPKNKSLKFHNEYQSNLSNKMVYDIIYKDSCLLPTVENSYSVHCELFRIFNNHINKLQNTKRRLCPIT